jgi:S1-C subfamily serine protease
VRLSRRISIACLLAGATLSGGVANAAEGFFTDKLPPAVRAAWPSVFAFVCEGKGTRYVASAFVVKKDARGAAPNIYFITAGHAVEDCKGPRRYLVEDINQPRFESDGITIAPQLRKLEDVSVVHVDDRYDIAVVKASAPTNLRVGNPLAVNGECDRALHHRIYAVGFPGVGQRRSLAKLREVKRWSSGDYVGLGRAEFRGTEQLYIASSVDSLPGSSGGPVLDDNGALIGVIAKGAAAPENGFRYDVDPKKTGDWQTFIVPCQAVLRILQTSGIASPVP